MFQAQIENLIQQLSLSDEKLESLIDIYLSIKVKNSPEQLEEMAKNGNARYTP